MGITARRVIIEGPRQVALAPVEVPSPVGEQLLVEAVVSGVSAGTERMWYNGSAPALRSGRRSYPYIPGYELVGRVIQVGQDVSDVTPGDLVVAMAPHASHVLLDGARPYVRWPPDVDVVNAVFAALGGTAIHALRRGGLELGTRVAVVGLGTLGMMVIHMARAGGAASVLAIGRSPWKLDLAVRAGADRAVSGASREVDLTLLSSRYRPELIVEASGTQAGIDIATDLAASEGRVVVAGFPLRPLSISSELVFAKELDILGVRAGGAASESTDYPRWDRRKNFAEAVRLLAERRIDGSPLVTHRVSPESVGDVYEMIDGTSERYLQVVLNW